MRKDERAVAEPALATHSLTGLFIVQWDASSPSHKSIFFAHPSPVHLHFLWQGKTRFVFVCEGNSEQGLFLCGSPPVVDEVTISFNTEGACTRECVSPSVYSYRNMPQPVTSIHKVQFYIPVITCGHFYITFSFYTAYTILHEQPISLPFQIREVS